MTDASPVACHARTDDRDWLIDADEPLAGLQLRAGGEIPGLIVAPALLDLVRKSRRYGLRLARPIKAQDQAEQIAAWVEVTPEREGGGCRLTVSNWQEAPLPAAGTAEAERHRLAIIRQVAELSARLGPNQELLWAEASSPELEDLARRMREGLGRPWIEYVSLNGSGPTQKLHWRLLDGARLQVPDSLRNWSAHLVPLGVPIPGSAGFELHLVSDEAPPGEEADTSLGETPTRSPLGREIAPVLRQPVARIIANAETIRMQLAGPLAEEYSNYAADIATAGEHLLALIDDLADLEVVEDDHFTTAPDRIDLADLARRAAGILGVRARERGVEVDAPKLGEQAPAIGEFRRVLQVLLNLLGNAIRYSPEGSQVWLRTEINGSLARVVVADQGQGLSLEQQARAFEKFERLGRSGDGGSGLGLYISRRLATAMGGTLSVESSPGQGARFILELPADTRGEG